MIDSLFLLNYYKFLIKQIKVIQVLPSGNGSPMMTTVVFVGCLLIHAAQTVNIQVNRTKQL
jgi:hypothetical protein